MLSAAIVLNLRNLQRQRNVNQHIQEQCLARAMSDLANNRSSRFNLGIIQIQKEQTKVTFSNGHQVMLK